jgi:hypothetical protein
VLRAVRELPGDSDEAGLDSLSMWQQLMAHARAGSISSDDDITLGG